MHGGKFFSLGLIALAYSLKSSAKADVKFHDKARLYSRRALIWNWISVIFAVLSTIMVKREVIIKHSLSFLRSSR